MISSAVVSGIGTFLITAIIKIWAAKSEANARAMEAAITRYRAEAEERKAIRAISNFGFSFTRRVLAIGVVGSVVIVPLVAPVFDPFIPISICSQASTGTEVLFGLFSYDNAKLACTNTNGIQVMPFHVDMVFMVLGFYLGDRVTKR